MTGSRYLFYGYVIFMLPDVAHILIAAGVIPSFSFLIKVPQLVSILFVLFMYQAMREQRMAVELSRKDAEIKIKIAQELAESEKKRREEQSRFMRLGTHELKTPLAVIDRAIQTVSLENEDIDPILAERHARIKTSISELNSLINNTLISENSDIASLRPRLSKIDCNTLITQLIERLSEGKQRCHIILPEGLNCTADKPLLELVASNLLINAMKYSQANAPISIRAEAITRYVVTGIQISITNSYKAEVRSDTTRWFQKYYRQTDTSGIQGFGLGLYLVKEIIQAHAGFIDCRVAGSYSPWLVTFELWLPDRETELAL